MDILFVLVLFCLLFFFTPFLLDFFPGEGSLDALVDQEEEEVLEECQHLAIGQNGILYSVIGKL